MSEPRVFNNRRRRGPEDGKIVVAAPEVAARMADQAPDLAERVYTLPDIEPTVAYVIDLDYVFALPPWRP